MTVKIVNETAKVEILSFLRNGMTKSELGRRYSVSPDTITRILKEDNFSKNSLTEHNVMKVFGRVGIKGDICVHDIIVTGLEEDGVLYANDAFTNMEEEPGNYAFSEYDVHFNGTLVVGQLVLGEAEEAEENDVQYVDGVDQFDYIFPAKLKAPKPEPVKIEAKPEEAPFVWNANSKFISITKGRETWNADKDHPNFKFALQHLIDDEVETARDLINIERAVKSFVSGNVRIEDGVLFYQDIELRSGLVDRIIDRMNKGEDFKFFLPFLENLLENPSPSAVSRLFDFLEANDIEITADGHFIGWKVVNKDYTDCHTGKFDNSPGQIVKMPRSRVTENDQVTCSQGLHVCSKSYIPHFGGFNSTIVSVKVNPRDVVSIPVDYRNAKMRTCQYEVLADVSGTLS